MSYKLLLADDSVTIQRVIELTFADEDVRVTAVGDGQAAIDRIEADPPDIVLADVGMPARDGYEVAAFVKESPQLSHIPVLLLTGAFEPVDEVRAQAVRCDGVLAKPFEPQLLIARVKELLAGGNRDGGAAEPGPVETLGEPAPVSALRDDEDTGPVPVAVPAQEFTAEDFALGSAPASGPMPAASPDLSLDDYFDRLDAAFASLTGAPAGQLKDGLVTEDTSWAPASAGAWSPADPGGLASAAAVPEPPPAPPTPESTSPEPVSVPSVTVADAFAALLDAEQQGKLTVPVVGEARVPAVTAVMAGTLPVASSASVVPPAPPVTDALVDEVVERLMARLGGDSLQAAVFAIVSETAERLVREEIERLKARA